VSPVICLITDRRRLGEAWEPALIERVRAAARAGVHLIHVRERDLAGGPIVRLTEQCVAAVRGTRARVVVNDRVDVALAARAHGVHLRGDSMNAARIRRIAPAGFLIGRSVHSVEDALAVTATGAVDYLVFGSVFETGSKPGRGAAGLDALGAVSTATTVPVLAVGGISASRARSVARTGASGIAAIGLFADATDDAMRDIVEHIATAFDTPEGVP
jgi:thiamine-phosphate pyrophosphorylase